MRRALAGVVLLAALLPACSSPEQDDPRPVYFAAPAPVVTPSSGWAELGRVVAWGNGLRWADTIAWNAGIQRSQKRRPAVVSPPHHRAAASVQSSAPSTGRCGGDLPPCWVMNRESGGNIHAYNPTGCSGRGCYGKWQCDPRSCNGTGTEAEQDASAADLWDHGAGCSNWDAC